MEIEGMWKVCTFVRLVLMTVLVLSFEANASCFPALFNFGDSTSDTGGMHASFPTYTPAEFSPYGETYFHRPQSRYSDGRILLDFITQGLGLPFLDPYLQSVTSDFSSGANFATAGATVRSNTYLSPFNLDVQVLQFLQFQSNVLSILNQTSSGMPSRLPLGEYFSQGLYTISLGGNDFTYGYTKGQSVDTVKAYLPKVVSGITKAVKNLYNAGARHFLVWDIEPQGCLPYMLTLIAHNSSDLNQHGCLTAYNEASQYFNDLLHQSLQNLRSTTTNADVVCLSQYNLKMDLLTQNLTKNGFAHWNKACCGVPSEYNYDLYVNCGSSKKRNGTTITAVTCSDPSKYVIWDGVHNTEAANRYFADQLFSGKYFDTAFPLLTSNCGLSALD